jgi:hypothetical protein
MSEANNSIMEEITLNNGGSNPGVKGFKGNTLQQLPVVDWLADLPEAQLDTDLVEVQFKNTRKGYFVNSAHIAIEKGDMVAVEANPGHDIGVVTLMGRLVLSQIKKNRINMDRYEVRKVYRKVKPVDMEKYEEAKAKEQDTMIKARKIAKDMQLDMKIGDVEYQGDGSKAIFYYIADDRVDFRQLIKVFAEVFKTEQAIVRNHFVSGTHSIACALFGNLRHGDKLVSVTGTPYDTMLEVIGVT